MSENVVLEQGLAYTDNFLGYLRGLPTLKAKSTSPIIAEFFLSGSRVPMDPWGLKEAPKVLLYHRGALNDLAQETKFPDSLPAPIWKATAEPVPDRQGSWKAVVTIPLEINEIVTAFWFFKDNLTGNIIALEQHYRVGNPEDYQTTGGNIGLLQDAHFSDENLWGTSVGAQGGTGSLLAELGRVFSFVSGSFQIIRLVGGNSLFLMNSQASRVESTKKDGRRNQVQLENTRIETANLGGARGRLEDVSVGDFRVREDSALKATNLKAEKMSCSQSTVQLDSANIQDLSQVRSSNVKLNEGIVDGTTNASDSTLKLCGTEFRGNISLLDSRFQATGGSQKGTLVVKNSLYQATNVDFG